MNPLNSLAEYEEFIYRCRSNFRRLNTRRCDLITEDFFAALAAIDVETPRDMLELNASVSNGQLTFLEPAPH